MPSAEKILYFLSSAVLSIVGVAVLGYGMSAEWASSTMACSPSESNSFNGSATIQMGLFNGIELKDSCPRFSIDKEKVNGKKSVTLLIIYIYILAFKLFIACTFYLIFFSVDTRFSNTLRFKSRVLFNT